MTASLLNVLSNSHDASGGFRLLWGFYIARARRIVLSSPELPAGALRWLALKYLLRVDAEIVLPRAEYERRNSFVKATLNEATQQC